jgi:hypothetical protein
VRCQPRLGSRAKLAVAVAAARRRRHAGTNGRQRGTSRREDALDTVIALRRPDEYPPEQGARFEVHVEKLRNRIDSAGVVPFEVSIETSTAGPQEGIRWCSHDLTPRMLKRATELFAEGLTVREVAATLRISKSEAGRLRLRALADGILSPEDGPESNSQQIIAAAFSDSSDRSHALPCPIVPLAVQTLVGTANSGRGYARWWFEAARIVASVGAQTTLGSASALRTALPRLAPSALRDAWPPSGRFPMLDLAMR